MRGNRGEIVKEHRFVNHSKEYAKDGGHVNTAKQTRLRAWLIKFRGVSNPRNYISFFELLFNSKEHPSFCSRWFRG